MDIKQFSAKMIPEREQSTRRPTMPGRDSSSTGRRWSTRRKSLLAAAVLGLGLYLRRRRSGSSNHTASAGGDSPSVDDPTQSVDGEHPDAGDSTGRSLARRLAMTVVTTLAVSLARRAYRRFRRRR